MTWKKFSREIDHSVVQLTMPKFKVKVILRKALDLSSWGLDLVPVPPPPLSFWSFLTFLHHGNYTFRRSRETSSVKLHKFKGKAGQTCHQIELLACFYILPRDFVMVFRSWKKRGKVITQLWKIIIGSAEALPILCVRYFRWERERERERDTERERRKWRHHYRAKIGDEFTLSLAKNSHFSFLPSHFPSLPSRRGHHCGAEIRNEFTLSIARSSETVYWSWILTPQLDQRRHQYHPLPLYVMHWQRRSKNASQS